MGKRKPYTGKPMKTAAKIVGDLYDRRSGGPETGEAHEWSDLPTHEICEDIVRELRGENDD